MVVTDLGPGRLQLVKGVPVGRVLNRLFWGEGGAGKGTNTSSHNFLSATLKSRC